MPERFPSHSEVAKTLGHCFYSYAQTKYSAIKLVPRVRPPGYVADHSFPSNVEVKNVRIYTSSPSCTFTDTILN